ncbi:N-acetylglucosamine-6-phosphate deacetylase [Sphingopyxis sp. XHP0097]|uniref:N-acetylglucosamine-6-phosphate deacetylase n=1 Tax=Sphingopyxis jiangsuensis TaxID=2871171 RepID=A0ABS7ME12_9SPHN|nr:MULTISPECIES: N-acetylglucosamine-6-phosphate deacetylase [Sphingopyxis]MBY4636316.1 N-acetylglucosamine-6-phosphate deacetylase [Sphingopyxis jiangsuensis]
MSARFAIAAPLILAADGWRREHAVIVRDAAIEAVLPVGALPGDLEIERFSKGLLLPGFVDTQVNGGGGVLFNDAPTVETIATIAAAHRRFGTTTLLPTLISDDVAIIERAIAAVEAAIAAGVPSVAGIHIEGPFLNEGKRGIHDATKFRRLDEEAVTLLSSLRGGRTLVTLAPELAPAGLIRRLVDAGVIVAAGHTLASYDDMMRARDEGIRGVTHLFNAMTGLDSRAPGVVGAALDSDLVCGLIVDGHHVHPASLRAAFRAKGAGELMLVTDAMATVGTRRDHFMLGSTLIREQDGALRAADGTLAGSALDMAAAVRGAVTLMQLDLADASRMASATPAEFLGLGAQRGRIAQGLRADLVLLDRDLAPLRCWIGGATD